MLRFEKAQASLVVIIIIVIIIFLGAWIYQTSGECGEDIDCPKDNYCGADRQCHQMEIVHEKSYDLVLPAIILAIGFIIAAIILRKKNFKF